MLGATDCRGEGRIPVTEAALPCDRTGSRRVQPGPAQVQPAQLRENGLKRHRVDVQWYARIAPYFGPRPTPG